MKRADTLADEHREAPAEAQPPGDGPQSAPISRGAAERRGPRQYVRRESAEALFAQSSHAEPPPALTDPGPETEELVKRPSFLVPLLNLSLFLAAVIGHFATAQAAILFNQIALLPAWLRPFGYALLAAGVLVLVYFGGKSTWFFLRRG